MAQRRDYWDTVVSSDLYDAYGAKLAGNPKNDPYGYNGQWGYYTDSETGMALCTYRYYDPANGRWVTRDPIGYDGGVNLYGYVKNDPATSSDPFGLKTRLCYRPVFFSRAMSASHWYFQTDKCGSVGYGPAGVMFGEEANLNGWKKNDRTCIDLDLTDAQEYCLCTTAKRAQKGWRLGGKQWKGNPNGERKQDEFGVTFQSCQDFANADLEKCAGFTIPFTLH